jgi:type I restriction enzyme S subunit
MTKYQSYKSSGVEWIGDIPFDWNLSKYKYKLKILSGYPFKSELFDSENGFPLLRIRDITSGSIETYYNGDFDEKYIIKRGDVVIGMDGDFNIREWDNDDILLNQRCCKVQEYDGILLKFIYYTLPFDLKIINDLTYYTTVKHLSVDDLYNIKCVLPPIKEQLQIVQFLDEKTDLIDKLISTKEKKISLLKEQRTSLINQVVTKGLNPNIKMKDSGVEWIGEIPEHWFCVGTNKVYQDLGTGTTPTSDNKDYYSEDGFHWITTTDLNEGVMYDTLTKISEKSLIDYPNLRLYPFGSIYISMYGGRIGKLGVSTFDSYCNQSVCVLPKNDKINVKFYYYWFLGFQDLVKNMGRGGGQPNINKEMIKQFPTVKIDLDEQNEIVEYLDSKTKDIDDLVSLEQKKIDLLKEYRQSLISEVVTGKIKVTTDE